MRTHAPFQPADLVALDGLLEQATAVVTMAEIHAGVSDPRIIGLRHDVDNVIEPAVEFAHWEAERGYRATYFVLHSAPYWSDKDLLRSSLEEIASQGHEIGIHNAACSEAVRTGGDPADLLYEAIEELREYGYEISGTVAHGAPECYGPDGKVRLVNDELFVECARPEMGTPWRRIGKLDLIPATLASFGLDYDANWLGRGAYLSESGGHWSKPGLEIMSELYPFPGQLHLLVHPCHWSRAFAEVRV